MLGGEPAPSATPEIPAARASLPVIDGTPVPRLEFVEVVARSPGTDPEAGPPEEPRWNLWDEPGALSA